jgi:hypothetical protein
MRLGKREKLKRAGLAGVRVEERVLSGGVVVDAGPRDRLVGGGVADRANEAGRTEIVRVGTAEWQTRLYRNEALMAAVLRLPEPPDFFQPFLNALFQAAIRGEIIAPPR